MRQILKFTAAVIALNLSLLILPVAAESPMPYKNSEMEVAGLICQQLIWPSLKADPAFQGTAAHRQPFCTCAKLNWQKKLSYARLSRVFLFPHKSAKDLQVVTEVSLQCANKLAPLPAKK